MREAKLLSYLKLDMRVHREMGSDCAMLYACLKLLAKRQKQDDYGYFQVDHAFFQPNLGFGKDKLLRTRKKLIDKGMIEVIEGRNQNQKPRYKIVVK